ncbi:molecular chaperone (small heat shock protein) [Aequorivita sublithincola DSM 14238]|uniref:Molecular chaperone (Small heat shock protein) n=1 Tax=Aequorivita sublithincola (strain DSM 14238 / LMG 21431 / ACAM 643 / 9-3) TaxID=746697 RepID=I3YRH3_AEQSU|nr:Hsp20/alpha crystallin family protein [Aequorivita sublithincola]AFL79591.1 molecular chaperone (small heat shock protein) [Aequorivita sublithincola DSM 14238]
MKTVNKNNMWLPGLLDNLFLENRLDGLNNYETFSNPAINIIENLPNFVVELAVPGLKKEDFTIEFEEDTLKVASKKVEEKKEETDSKFRRREFNFKSFERSFKLPENIKTEDIQANYENGILRVTLPKMEEKKVLKKMVEIS